MEEQTLTTSHPDTSRRHFLDLLLGASVLGWLASIAYPVIRYLKPLPQTGPTGPTHLTRDETAKLEQNQFVIDHGEWATRDRFATSRINCLPSAPSARTKVARSHICWAQSIIWCPCHDGRFDLNGRVLSGPPPRPLPKYAVQRQPDGGIVISEEKA